MASRINTSNIGKASAILSETLDNLLNNESTTIPVGYRFNAAKLKNIVKQHILSPGNQTTVKRILVDVLKNVEPDYRTSLESMMIGEGTAYTKTSSEYLKKIEAAFPVSPRSRRTHRWIMNAWGGDWYTYKRSLASRRLVKTGKQDDKGRDIFRVYAGKLGTKNKPQRSEDNPGYYMTVGKFRDGDRSKQMNKTLKTAKLNQRGGAGKGTAYITREDNGVQSRGMTKRLNPVKIGARTARELGNKVAQQSPSYAVTQAMLMAQQLRDGQKPNQNISSKGTGRKNTRVRAKTPYAKTGKMAKSYANTFTFRSSDIKFVAASQTPGGSNSMVFNISGNFKPSSMAADYRRAYLRTPVLYKQILVYSAGKLFADMVNERLYEKGKIGGAF